jgi:hypothetical protein
MFEQAMLASYSVQKKSVAPCNCCLMYQKAFELEDDEI